MLRIIQGGVQAVVEDWPGRLGYLGAGMAPAGAMDNVALELGNLLVGNEPGEAGIEIAVGMFSARFEADTVIAVTGADLKPTINGREIPMWESIKVKEGDKLKFGTYGEKGFRAYLTAAGGVDVPVYLGSKSTCLFGGYGGFEGRPLKTDDVIKFGELKEPEDKLVGRKVKADRIPEYSNEIELRLIPGMNAYPDFVTEEGMDYLFSARHKFSVNSNRSACRLDPLPDYFFAREDGGAGGSHPSNIIDHAYNMRGAINVTGNTPSLLTADGPTLGGFMCCGNVINADLWKIGQAAPDRDCAKFVLSTLEEAIEARKAQREWLSMDSILV
ncbi:biotin-dependent carboxyltransferase family protein [Anaerovorax odorimutans]|uniref:Biotin-dependent carboxyltransferase family protein n=1 Tax=Anaerovorax odorimutans TaxID=109327 RepID=A0ABT1RPJ3_9FIRM|nr:biotin-dependent carboxyltransferase family protein [Anaerovorax odorimutans]MCQ4637115.1 biotin-dependent carboxyltransferase family protein [Anaerovorax odorimutans]